MRIGRTRLPIPAADYDRSWGSALIRSVDQNFDAAFAGIENAAAITGYYGSFFSTQNQAAIATLTPYAMTLNNTAESNQIAVTSNSRITFNNRGIYNIQFSAQFTQTSASEHFIWIWFRKNGTDIPNSATKISIKGSKGELVPAWNFIVNVLGGDYIQIMWAVEDTGISLLAEGSTAFAPAIPSVIATAVSV